MKIAKNKRGNITSTIHKTKNWKSWGWKSSTIRPKIIMNNNMIETKFTIFYKNLKSEEFWQKWFEFRRSNRERK